MRGKSSVCAFAVLGAVLFTGIELALIRTAQEKCHEGTPNGITVFSVFLDPVRPDAVTPWRILKAAVELAAASSNSVVHVLSDHNETIRACIAERITIRDVRLLKAPLATEFLSLYRHQSTNPPIYERGCLWRWLVLDAYVEELLAQGAKPICIAALDTDVMLMQPLRDILPAHVRHLWLANEVFMPTAGAVVLWSPVGLRNFGDFLIQAYRDLERLKALISVAGQLVESPCRAEKTQVLACFNNSNSAKPTRSQKQLQYHFSDMHALLYFISTNSRTRHRNHGDQTSSSCRTVSMVSKLPENTTFSFHPRGSLTFADGVPVCYLHFQGSTKELISSFLKNYRSRTHSFKVR